jgi:hypothetical protein
LTKIVPDGGDRELRSLAVYQNERKYPGFDNNFGFSRFYKVPGMIIETPAFGIEVMKGLLPYSHPDD